MDKTITFLVKDTDRNLRLDRFLTSKLKTLTRSQIKKIINSNGVKINKKIVLSPSQKIKNRNLIEISVIQKKNENIKPKKMDIDIVYEDKDLIIVNKPSVLTVHPGAGNKEKLKEWII